MLALLPTLLGWMESTPPEAKTFVSNLIGWLIFIVSGLTASATVIHRKSPARKLLVWLFKRNISQPALETAGRWVAHVTAELFAPNFAEVKANAKAQHDAQNLMLDEVRNATEQGFMSVHRSIDGVQERIESTNERIDGTNSRIDKIDERLDKGADRLARHDIDIAVLQARDPSTRSRKDDHP